MPGSKKIHFFLALVFSIFISQFSTTKVSAATLPYCGDYFRDNWNVRLSMDDAASGFLKDIPDGQIRNVNGITYVNGTASFTSTATPSLRVLEYTVGGSIPEGSRYGAHHPIDTSVYKYFVVRMYSPIETIASIQWFFTHDRYATTSFTVYPGWHVYSVYLPSATIVAPYMGSPSTWTSGTVTGLDFIPTNAAGVSMFIDWIQLARGDCTSRSVSYSGTGGAGLYRQAVVDTNSTYSDGFLFATTPTSGTSHSIPMEKLIPGNYTVYGVELADWFALNNDGNMLDMNESTDISSLNQNGISNGTFAGGLFTATISADDSSFYVNVPYGKTIDPSVFKYLSMKLTYSFPGGVASGGAQLFLFDESGNFAPTPYAFTPQEGTAVYNFDISGFARPIKSIRIDPTDSARATFSLDFVSVRSDGYTASLSSPTPSAIESDTIPDLRLDFVQPDERGGTDFAQTVLGKAWNMSSTSDFVNYANLSSAKQYRHALMTDSAGNPVTGDFFLAYNANGDPINYSLFLNGNIDTTRFVNFCFKGWNANETPQFNSVARVIYQDPRVTSFGEESYRTGDDIIMNRGTKEYCLDFRSSLDYETEPPLASGSPNPWTSISENGKFVDLLRLDMNENSENGYYYVIDYIHLRSDHEANTKYAVVIDAPMDQAVSVYYNTSASTSGGSLLTTFAAGRNTNVYAWDTTNITPGTYYVYGTSTANGNTLSRLAPGRIQISRTLTQDTTPPILSCERPNEGYAFDTGLEVAGYALDETRTAAVEIFTSVDNSTFTYFGKVTPQNFHLGARDAYESYAEANNPGFQQIFDSSALPMGTNYIKIVATDTAGNQTSCTRTTTRSNGASTAPLTYPAPDNVSNSITVTTPTPTSLPAVSLTVSMAKNKKSVTYNATGCDTATIQGATSSKSSAVFTDFGQLRNGQALSKNPKVFKGKPSTLYIRAVCSDSRKSSNVKLNISKVNGKPAKTLAVALKALKSGFKAS